MTSISINETRSVFLMSSLLRDFVLVAVTTVVDSPVANFSSTGRAGVFNRGKIYPLE